MGNFWHFAKLSIKNTVVWTPVVVTFDNLVYSHTSISGVSMQPILNPDIHFSADHVLVEKFSLLFCKYTRGDVVLLRSPNDPKALLVKRLLALEGDKVLVPGRLGTETIPEGHCWVEGENSQHSFDSRTRYGPVPVALIEGRVTHIVWPPSRMMRVQSCLPKGRLAYINPNPFRRVREPDPVQDDAV